MRKVPSAAKMHFAMKMTNNSHVRFDHPNKDSGINDYIFSSHSPRGPSHLHGKRIGVRNSVHFHRHHYDAFIVAVS